MVKSSYESIRDRLLQIRSRLDDTSRPEEKQRSVDLMCLLECGRGDALHLDCPLGSIRAGELRPGNIPKASIF